MNKAKLQIIVKVRRRIEDFLRKAPAEIILEVAKMLGVKTSE